MTLTQQLIKTILEHGTTFYDNSNGPYQEECPCCGCYKEYKGNEVKPTMQDLKHHLDCAWLLANRLQQEEYPEMIL